MSNEGRPERIVIAGGTVATGSGPAAAADVLIDGGRVTAIDHPGSFAETEADRVVDATGCWVGPGLVDLHTHMREPGQEWKEDIESASAAAAAGGFTAVVAMPNTDPPIDAGHLARFVMDRGRDVGLVDVAVAGCITAGRGGVALAHLDDLWTAGVRIFTDDGDTVADAGLLRRAMEYLADRGGIIAQHAIDPGLAAGGQLHEGPVSSRLGLTGIPTEAETIVIARDLALVRLTGARYHVQHLSSAAAVDQIAAAKARGLPVTAEVTPHHLVFTHDDAAATDPNYKMMPPLRTEEDRAALRDALASGVIDVVATDHAPHAAHEKDVPWEDAPMGVTGLEWAAAVAAAVLDVDRFFSALSTMPAELAGLTGHGTLRPGGPANLVVFDPTAPTETTTTRSRSSNAPWLGREMKGRVRLTMKEGRVTHLAGSPAEVPA